MNPDDISSRSLLRPVPGSLLAGQKALVTGASSGIGRAVAIALAEAGADVAINFLEPSEAANEVVSAIHQIGTKAMAIRADVSREDQVQVMFKQAVEELGTIDIVVNNAGIQNDAPIDRMTLEQWDSVIGTNLTGQFLCSVHEVIPWAGRVNYAASKGGIMLLMKSIAQEVASLKIRANSICPGAIRTPLNRSAWEEREAYNELMTLIPYKRIGEPDEIGRLAVFLASDYADYITGASIFVDGGMTLYPGFETGG
jgi:glucose 1-dehydrogenase